MPFPPWSEVWDALRYLIAPAFGAALLMMLIVRLLVGERGSSVAAVLAVCAGVLAGNHFREAMTWRIDSDRPLDTRDLRTVLGWSLEGKPPAEPVEGEETPAGPDRAPPARYWLPWLINSVDLRLVGSEVLAQS